MLKHLLLPRFKGFVATVSGLQDSEVKAVCDVTFCYYHRTFGPAMKPSFLQIFTGRLDDFSLHIHVARIPLSDLPQGEEGLKKWIFDRFIWKDRLIDSIQTIYSRTQSQ